MYEEADYQQPHDKKRLENFYCYLNFKKYLKETTLHGLRFIGDDTITIWERGFFFWSVVGAIISIAYFFNYFFAKWDSTPVLIGVSPYPSSIADIPFPAITLCNMNQLSLKKVRHFSNTSFEQAMMDMACFDPTFLDASKIPNHYKYNNLSLTDFLIKHAQPCSSLFVKCYLNSKSYNCTNLFQRSLTDEGMCCVFNILHPNFLYKMDLKADKLLTEYPPLEKAEAVNWSPETGYPKNLPEEYYPRPAAGIGVSMGLTIVLDAQVHDYYCASTNGPGFKFTLHSPVESARVKDNGLTVGVGEEIRFSITPQSSSATQNIRNLKWSIRNCLFSNEGDLTYYKYFTRRNCENECQAQYIYEECGCIPYNLPLLYRNATFCGAPQYFCMDNAQNIWMRSKDSTCRGKCFNSCFDLTYLATAYTSSLVEDSYWVQNEDIIRSFNRTYLKQNVAVVHFFFQEFVFYSTVRNVYIGFTEFLSYLGGIFGLFMGFSFISVAELIYFAFTRPFFYWRSPKKEVINITQAHEVSIWLGNELLTGRHQSTWHNAPIWHITNHRKFKNDSIKSPNLLKRLQNKHKGL